MSSLRQSSQTTPLSSTKNPESTAGHWQEFEEDLCWPANRKNGEKIVVTGFGRSLRTRLETLWWVSLGAPSKVRVGKHKTAPIKAPPLLVLFM